MQSGAWPFSDVQEIKTSIIVNGYERPHESWSVEREISGDLPMQVASGSGLRQATGSVAWAFREDVTADPVSPWNAFGEWLPKRGDRIEIWAGNSEVSYCQFKGFIDKTTGTIGEGFQSTIIDGYDRGSVRLRHEGLLAVMPPHSPGGAFRGTGLVHTYYTDLAFRSAGYYVTPPAVSAAVHVPCQGGMWPHIGSTVTASTHSGGSYPVNRFSSWGFVCGDFIQTLLPNSPKSASTPVQLTFVVAPSHDGFYYMRASYGSTYVQLSINRAWGVTANIGGVSVASFTLTGKGGTVPHVVQMLVKGGQITIKASTGQSASGSASFSGATLMSTVLLSGDIDTRVSGLEVSHPPVQSEFNAISFQPTATINVSNTTMMGIQRAAPPIIDQSANSLLDEISKATLSACWIDETGVMRWWPSIALQGQSSAQTVTTLNDVLDLQWEEGLLQSAARVSIRYKALSLRLSKFQNLRLYLGSGGTLESDETSEDVAEAPADEAWYGVDETPAILRTGNWAQYNRPLGTYLGGFFTSNGATVSEAGLTYTGQMVKLAHDSYLIKQSVGTLPTDVVFNLATSPTDPSLWDNRRDKSLFEIGGHGVAKWTDTVFTPAQAGGVGPELEHDGGIWIPDTAPQIYFDFIAGQTATPQPVISGLEVVFDPRRQVGDVISIVSEKYMRVTLTALIVGISTTADPDGASHSLSVRVLNATKNSQTYEEYDTSLAGSSLTYAQWQALGPLPQTYEEFNDA